MKLVDSNVWLALTLSKHVFHSSVHAWLAAETQAAELLFCRSTQQSLLRLLTTSAVLSPYGVPALTNRQAWELYELLMADSRIAWSDEPAGLESLWQKLAVSNMASPKQWMDAYLAAFAMAGGYQLVSTDRGFAQYPGLQFVLLPSHSTPP